MFSRRNISEYLEDHAVRRARHAAIVEGDKTLTYRQLGSLVRRTAGHFRDVGVIPGDIVGVCLRDSADHLVVMFALARLGAVILPLDWRWTGSEKQRVTKFFDVVRVVVESGDNIEGCQCLAIDSGWHAAVATAEPNAPISEGGGAPIVLSLSSGTTGRPKGPMMSHAQFISRLVIQWVTLGFSQHDRYLSATPLYFGGGRSFAIGSLFSGGTVVMFPPPYEPEHLVAAVAELKPTTLLLVPTLLRKLLQLPAQDGPLLGALTRLLSTGAVLHPDERKAVMEHLHPEFINYYGSTEGGGITVLLPEHQGAAAASVGEPVFATDVQVVDEDDKTLSAGAIGRIRYRGPSVAAEFYKDPEASAESFRDGWFYPGDLGRLDQDGRLFLTGRTKDVIIRAGVNIYPVEIEEVLLGYPTVRDAAVIGWDSPLNGEEVAAFVVAISPIEIEDLLEHCRRNLAPYKIPYGIFVIDDLPKTPLGKVVKPDLKERLPILR